MACLCKTPCNSWILVRRSTGEAFAETYDPRVIAVINPATVEALRPCEYLPRLNRKEVQ